MAKLIAENLPKSEATIFGNLDQMRKNTMSTNSEQLALEMETYFYPEEGKTQILYLSP